MMGKNTIGVKSMNLLLVILLLFGFVAEPEINSNAVPDMKITHKEDVQLLEPSPSPSPKVIPKETQLQMLDDQIKRAKRNVNFLETNIRHDTEQLVSPEFVEAEKDMIRAGIAENEVKLQSARQALADLEAQKEELQKQVESTN